MPEIGTFCFAKVRGYPEWPAFVTSIKKPNHIWVKFFNSPEVYVLNVLLTKISTDQNSHLNNWTTLYKFHILGHAYRLKKFIR